MLESSVLAVHLGDNSFDWWYMTWLIQGNILLLVIGVIDWFLQISAGVVGKSTTRTILDSEKS